MQDALQNDTKVDQMKKYAQSSAENRDTAIVFSSAVVMSILAACGCNMYYKMCKIECRRYADW
jgi:hypothetical protein